MSVDLLTRADVAPFASIQTPRLDAMIADAHALAWRAAPCLTTATDPDVIGAARAILRGAVLRWNEAGSGALTQQAAGPFSQTVDTRAVRRGLFWPSEVADLQALCPNAATERGVFAIDTAPDGRPRVHGADCSRHYAAPWCSCGAQPNNTPPLGRAPEPATNPRTGP